jgi:hypothetical protein
MKMPFDPESAQKPSPSATSVSTSGEPGLSDPAGVPEAASMIQRLPVGSA